MDFAGSAAVHVLGGTAALVACILIGPRTGRFAEFGGRAETMSGHSMPLASLGGFILLFGFLAFNAGSQVSYYTLYTLIFFYRKKFLQCWPIETKR